ncbi:MAG: hypothetical protein CMA77_05920 [Euryarchaeota archaeon]|nr:hypothetical protein [Euryarchaeota archaeon]
MRLYADCYMGQDWVVPDERTSPYMKGEELRLTIENTNLLRGETGICWLTQASWLVKFRNCTILIDPWWRDLDAGDRWGKLLGEFPLSPDEFPPIDYIFCTHWHDDHICPTSLPLLAKQFPSAKFIVPLRSSQMLIDMGISKGRIRAMRGNDSGQLNGGLSFVSIPAAHEELDVDDIGSHLYLGYIIRCDGNTLFHMGDSRPYPGWEENIEKATKLLNDEKDGSSVIDIAFLCINGNDNLRHDEAVDLAEKMDFGLSIPMHYGMDPGNTVDPQIFVDEIDSRGSEIQYLVANPGEFFVVE